MRPRSSKTRHSPPATHAAGFPSWVTPPAVFEAAAERKRRKALHASARTLLLIAIICYVFYRTFSPHLPPAFKPEHTAFGLVFISFLYAIAIYADGRRPYKPAQYHLCHDGIHISTRDHPLLRYDTIGSFTLAADPDLPDRQQLTLHAKAGFAHPIHLPDDPRLTASILEHLSRHLPQSPPLPIHAPLRRSDWIRGAVAAAVYSLIIALVLQHHYAAIRAHRDSIFFLYLAILAGPGTLSALLLFRRRASAQLFLLAVVLNLLCFALTMPLLVLKELTSLQLS